MPESLLLFALSTLLTGSPNPAIKINDSSLSILGFELEKAKLKNIQKFLGKAPVFENGDASESDTRLNYYLENEGIYLVFASGELGGGEVLTDVRMEKKINEKYLRTSHKLSENDFCGARIGHSRKQIEVQMKTKLVGDTNPY